MSRLTAAIRFIAEHRRSREPLTWSRIQKLLYLADWKAAIDGHDPLTGIAWHYTQFGPGVEDAESLLHSLSETPPAEEHLAGEDEELLRFILDVDTRLSWEQLDDLVRSTFPVVYRAAGLSLREYAEEYIAALNAYRASDRSGANYGGTGHLAVPA